MNFKEIVEKIEDYFNQDIFWSPEENFNSEGNLKGPWGFRGNWLQLMLYNWVVWQ